MLMPVAAQHEVEDGPDVERIAYAFLRRLAHQNYITIIKLTSGSAYGTQLVEKLE